MKIRSTKTLIVALAITGTALVGTPAFAAAATPTLVLSGGSSVFGLDPAIIVATAGAPGNVAFSVGTNVIKGCEAIATTTVAPFVAKCTWAPAAPGATVLNATLTPTDTVGFTVANATPITVKIGTPVQGTTPSQIGRAHV